jgi:phosphate transport system substrate-binding protein
MAGNEQIAADVSKNANGVGYVGMAYTKANGVKVVSIDGSVPSGQTVQNHSYFYWRPTFYYTNGEPGGLAKQFVDFTVGPAGQKIVSQVGFVPIKNKVRRPLEIE